MALTVGIKPATAKPPKNLQKVRPSTLSGTTWRAMTAAEKHKTDQEDFHKTELLTGGS